MRVTDRFAASRNRIAHDADPVSPHRCAGLGHLQPTQCLGGTSGLSFKAHGCTVPSRLHHPRLTTLAGSDSPRQSYVGRRSHRFNSVSDTNRGF